jgi:hypothetical protein
MVPTQQQNEFESMNARRRIIIKCIKILVLSYPILSSLFGQDCSSQDCFSSGLSRRRVGGEGRFFLSEAPEDGS